jgi:hypothetical protein
MTASPTPRAEESRVELHWIPLGAGDGSHCVRWNGRVFEAIVARRHHRPRRDLFHSALIVHSDGVRYTIEMAPEWAGSCDRGVVCGGPVGLRALGRSRWFRYEIRRWRDGVIPDLAEANGTPVNVSTDRERTRRLLDLVSSFPTLTWGRDEQRAGEMWNSNSLISWLLIASGHDVTTIPLPARGRAPGWHAGAVVASRRMPWPIHDLELALPLAGEDGVQNFGTVAG